MDQRDLTTGEAAAWRAGWAAAREAMAAKCKQFAKDYAAEGHADTYVLLWEYMAQTARAMEPPA